MDLIQRTKDVVRELDNLQYNRVKKILMIDLKDTDSVSNGPGDEISADDSSQVRAKRLRWRLIVIGIKKIANGPFSTFSYDFHIFPWFLARLHYCYTPGVSVGVCMQNVRANVKVLEFQSFCIFFFLHFNFVYHSNKAPYNKKFTAVAHPVTVTPLVLFNKNCWMPVISTC